MKKIIDILLDAQDDLSNLPVGGIGLKGATQNELDEAASLGQAYDDDAEYHQGQQAWLKIELAIQLLSKKLKITK